MEIGRIGKAEWTLKAILFCGVAGLTALQPLRAGAQPPPGAVEGRVFDRGTGDPLEGVSVVVSAAQIPGSGLPGQEGEALSGADGTFRIEGLEPGSYRAFALTPGHGYIGQIYSELACAFLGAGYSGGGCADFLPFAGDPFILGAGATVAGIDFPLVLGGEIAGTVTGAEAGVPLRTLVGLTGAGGDEFTVLTWVLTDPQGRFRFRALPAGLYSLILSEVDGYFSGVVTGVSVSLGEETVADATLEPWTTLSGLLSELGSGDPIGEAAVRVYDSTGAPVETAQTGFDGTYRTAHLEDGTYYLRTAVGFDRPWVDQLFGAGVCVDYRPCDVTAGTPLVIAGGTSVAGIDLELPVGGGIAGTTSRGTEPQLSPVLVYGDDGTFVGADFSDRVTGTYEVEGLAGGTYYLLGLGVSEPPQLYENLPCGPDNSNPTCDVTTGTPVAVAPGQTTPGIDFVFPVSSPGACAATDARLCLNGGRFEVEMIWETKDLASGHGAAVDLPFADDSGYFWFFDPDNVEVVVKVLDACHTRFNSFWVFAAGLTNVRVEMRVTDTVSGEVRTYTNPQRTPFAPILDTRAFRTCDAEVPLGGGTAAATGVPSELGVAAREALRLLGTLPAAGGATCTPDATHLCLQGGRFRVAADWRTPNGSSGSSEAFALTDDTGVYSFFGSDNLEVVVKVLSNCQGPSRRFWVFAGGLTNLEVTLRVTDTLTGDLRTYVNPQGEPFEPIQDTRAFDTCGQGG